MPKPRLSLHPAHGGPTHTEGVGEEWEGEREGRRGRGRGRGGVGGGEGGEEWEGSTKNEVVEREGEGRRRG